MFREKERKENEQNLEQKETSHTLMYFSIYIRYIYFELPPHSILFLKNIKKFSAKKKTILFCGYFYQQLLSDADDDGV